MLHTYWVGDAMGIFKKHYRMNAKIALNIRIPPFWTDSEWSEIIILMYSPRKNIYLKDKRRKKYRYIGTQKYSTIPRNLQTPIWSVGSINIDEENFKKFIKLHTT